MTPFNGKIHLFLAVLAVKVLGFQGFLQPVFPTTLNRPVTDDISATSKTSLFLAKKRRRRKTSPSKEPKSGVPDSSSPESAPSDDSQPLLADGELPDFELMDESPEPAKTAPLDLNPDEITANMLGAPVPVDSAGEIQRDRGLEAKMVFEPNPEAESLPDFADLARAAGDEILDPSTMSKKEYRKAMAIKKAKQEREEESTGLLENIPFVKDEKGEVNSIKVRKISEDAIFGGYLRIVAFSKLERLSNSLLVLKQILEAGAWGGIFLLIAWEVYLNSPLFDRAAPMAPVVYDLLM